MKLLFKILILGLTIIGVTYGNFKCNKLQFKDSNSFVCVCNSTFCDTIEPLEEFKSEVFQEYVTSKNEFRLEKFMRKFQKTSDPKSQVNLSINRKMKFQAMKGFGGAITDSAGFNIYSVSPNTTNNLIKSYFSESGVEYNILRIPIGGTDFSLREYSYADEFQDDFELKNFTLQNEDIKWKIPFAQAALEMSKKNISLFGSPWTAPKWMKTNNDFKGNGTLIGPEGGKYYDTWAHYFLKFFKAYEKNGLKFWALTAQNEPTDGYLYKFTFNCMGFTPESQAIFLTKNLGPLLKKQGYPDIKIMILDDQRLFLPAWPKAILDYSTEATKYFDGIAVHWYLDFLTNPKVLDQTHKLMPDKWIFGTEACAGSGPLNKHVIIGDFSRAENYAKFIIQDLNHWVTGWTDWNLALDLNGGPNWAGNFVDSPIIVNTTADEFYKQPMFYSMGHFSKFIREGSVRIELVGKQNDSVNNKISYVAFYMSHLKETTVIILNENHYDTHISIFDPDQNKYVNIVCTAHSLRTIVWYH